MISGIVLAAGSSTRMGRPKLLLPLAGRPILSHVVDAATSSPLDEVIVVVGPDDDELRSALGEIPERVRFVVNPDRLQGQSTSLGAGLRAADPASEAAIVLLGDQPGVSARAISAVAESFARSPAESHVEVVQASYEGRPAHPTLLPRHLWEDVVRGGDEGARGWIAEHPALRRLVEVGGDPPADVDTPEDYERLRASFETT